MNFVIQASKPRISGEYNLGDRDISEAIETIFPMNTESAILQWNCISIPLSYKYDISYMIWDILNLLEQLQTEPQGMMMIQWLPDTFRVDWKIVWKDNQMTIKSYWESVVGGLEELLNQKPVISLKIDNFLYEWKIPDIKRTFVVWKNWNINLQKFLKMEFYIHKPERFMSIFICL